MNRISYHTNSKIKEWIDDRVNTLIENNPEMEEGMAYGIAWKQMKKKFPGWEAKEGSRLRKISQLNY